MTPSAIGGGPELKISAMTMAKTRRAVGTKTNKPERIAARRASIAKPQIAKRFTQFLSPNSLRERHIGMKPMFRACPNLTYRDVPHIDWRRQIVP
jgi:hypothetical protein